MIVTKIRNVVLGISLYKHILKSYLEKTKERDYILNLKNDIFEFYESLKH